MAYIHPSAYSSPNSNTYAYRGRIRTIPDYKKSLNDAVERGDEQAFFKIVAENEKKLLFSPTKLGSVLFILRKMISDGKEDMFWKFLEVINKKFDKIQNSFYIDLFYNSITWGQVNIAKKLCEQLPVISIAVKECNDDLDLNKQLKVDQYLYRATNAANILKTNFAKMCYLICRHNRMESLEYCSELFPNGKNFLFTNSLETGNKEAVEFIVKKFGIKNTRLAFIVKPAMSNKVEFLKYVFENLNVDGANNPKDLGVILKKTMYAKASGSSMFLLARGADWKLARLLPKDINSKEDAIKYVCLMNI